MTAQPTILLGSAISPALHGAPTPAGPRLIPLAAPIPKPVKAPTPRPDQHTSRGPLQTEPTTEPDSPLGQWIARYVIAALEISVGCRPPAQVARWSSPEVHETLRRRHLLHTAVRRTSTGATPTRPGRGSGARLRSLRIRIVGPHAVEAAAVISDGFGKGRKGRAVALRVEWVDSPDDDSDDTTAQRRPRVVALELG